MKRRTLPVATAFAVTAALLLTACGGGDDKPATDDRIAGSEQGDKKPASPSATPAESAGHPKIKLPADVKDVFEGWATGDPKKDAALKDVARTQTATNDAILRGDIDGPGLPFYYQGEGLTTTVKWVKKWMDADLAYTGTTRYFNPEISMFDEKSAAAVFCADESKAFNKNRKTGEIDKTPSDEGSYVLYNTRLKKNEQGVWQTTKGVSKRGHQTCAS